MFFFRILEFRESKDVDIRRAAFLALWMSKCVFNSDPVQFMKPFTFPLAVVLSRGMSLPLGTLCLGTLCLEHSKDYIDVGKDVGDVKIANWVVQATGPNGELQFLGFEDGFPLLMKWMGLKVWNLPLITLLDDGAHFAWKPYSYVVAGFCFLNPFPNARPGFQEFGLDDHEKIPKFLPITSPSYILYPSDKPKKVKHKRASSENPKTSSPKAPAIVPSGSGAAPATKFSVPVVASTNALSPLKQCGRKTSADRSGDSEETQSEEYDFEDTTADFNKLMSLASISSRVSSPDVLYSLGPTDEDIEKDDEGFTIAVTIGETATGMPSQEHSEIPTEGQALLEEITAAEACIARDNETMLNELAVKIADLEKEIAAKTVELSLLVSQRDEMMQSSLTGGASSLGETFGDGLLD
nr:hypothetical protein CFP56_67316 [Quercus suber]